MGFFDRVFDNPDEAHNDAVVLSLSNKKMKKMFTKKDWK